MLEAINEKPPRKNMRAEYINGRKFLFKPLLSLDSANEVLQALSKKTQPPLPHLRLVLATRVGQHLFEGEARQMSYALFIETIENKIKGFEHLNYVEEEWNNFVIAMKVTTKQVMSGLPGFSKKACKLTMLNVPMAVSILSANDEWSFKSAHCRC